MSLLPYFFEGAPSHPFMDMDDLMASVAAMDRYYGRRPPWRSSVSGIDGGDKFQECLDVHQFAPEEITVKTIGDQIVVEAKHEEKRDEHGYVSRHFVRRYTLPEGYKVEDVVSTLSSDGVLSITAPKAKNLELGERLVPIAATGPARRSIEQNTEG